MIRLRFPPPSFPPFTPNADLYLLEGRVPLISKCVQRKPSLVAQMVKRRPTTQETWVQSLGLKDLLEKEMAIHSSILAWKIPWMEEPGRLQSMASAKSWTRLSDFTHSLLENEK